MLETSTSHPDFDKRLSPLIAKTRKDIQSTTIDGDRFFEEKTFDGRSMDFYYDEEIGFASVIPEGRPPAADEMKDGNKRTITTHIKGNALEFTGLSDEITPGRTQKRLMRLAESHKNSKELDRINFYNYALSGATVPTVNGAPIADPTCYDGLAAFHGAHTYQSSNVTNSNLMGADILFTTSGLEAVMQNTYTWKTSSGMPMGLKAKRIVAGDNAYPTLLAKLASDKTPEDANNMKNVAGYLNQGSAMPKVAHWTLMSANDWFIEMQLPAGDTGWVVAYLKGYKHKTRDFTDDGGYIRTLTYEYVTAVTAVHWAGAQSSRAAL